MADFKHVIRNFSGGLLEDKREQSPVHFSITKHFDSLTYPTKLVPYAETVASLGTASAGITTLGIINFLYAQHLSSSFYRLYGLGANGSGQNKVYVFDIDAGSVNTTNWVAAINGESNTGAQCPDVFFYYKGYIYMYSGGNTVQRYDTTEVSGFNTSYQSISYTNNAVQPVHHPSDDVAYFFDDHNVFSLNNTTWTTALALPTNETITAACPYGNYLAIATVTSGTLDNRSTVYLWDRDSSLTTLSERYDFGQGKIVHMASLNSRLIAVMSYYVDNLYAFSKGKIFIKTISGQFGVTLNTITTDTAATALPRTHYIENDKLYFPMSAPLNGDTRLGIWVVTDTGKVALDTIEPSATTFNAIFKVANCWWIAHSSNGSVTHTDGSGTYSSSTPSVWETLVLSTVNVTTRGTIIMNPGTEKKLVGATVTTEPLTSGQSVTLKYRHDSGLNNGAWTTIFTNSTVGSNNHDAINHESDKSNFPDYFEIQYRVESLGGAVVTGLEYGADIINKNLY